MMLKSCLYIACFMFFTTSMAQNESVKLFPDGAPGEREKLSEKHVDGGNVGGHPVIRLTNVGEPDITIYRAPAAIATGTAIVVCPGGGYSILAYDLEGVEVCEWLNQAGVTAILLKYRVPAREDRRPYEAPLQDVQRAIGYVRHNAQKWSINPDRVGVMGFSAGAHLSVMASTHYWQRTYPRIDAIDDASCRPDFCLLVYPAYLSDDNFGVAPEIKITQDDKSHINSSLFYYYALKEASVAACMHLYDKGGLGYGACNTGSAVNEWPQRAEGWLCELGLIK
jgi:acetyl esterase/lipase